MTGNQTICSLNIRQIKKIILEVFLLNPVLAVILAFIVIMSISGYFIMFSDKKKSIKNEWRIKESTIFMVALLGGSVGVYLGMRSFRHKTNHTSFALGIPLMIIIQTYFLIMLVSRII